MGVASPADGRRESPGRHNPHAHVVLPGTYYDADEGRRVPLYFNQNKRVNHIELLHTLTEQNMEVLMEHYVGREWEQQYDALHPTAGDRIWSWMMAGLSLDL